MKFAWLLGILCAFLLHAGVVLFGGLIFAGARKDQGTLQQVELLAPDDPAAKEKPPEEQPKQEELESQEEKPPDAAEILRNLDQPVTSAAPALDAVSLGAIEQALNGQGSRGDFSDALSFASGGRIGGIGKAGTLDGKLEDAFSLSEIDQKPRAVFQAAPLYPSEMRGKKVEGSVTLLFVVDATGKVSNPRVEKSSHPAFEKPALDALKQWKFEPAVKGGQRVGCKMRVPIRFQPS
jgi:protein TonB